MEPPRVCQRNHANGNLRQRGLGRTLSLEERLSTVTASTSEMIRPTVYGQIIIILVYVPLLAFTTETAVRDQLALVWGIEAFVMPPVESTDRMVAEVAEALLQQGRGTLGDRIVIVAGTPPGTIGSTNTVRVHVLGGTPPLGP